MTSLEIGKIAAAALDEKKAFDLKGIDIHELTVIADYFVLARSTSNTHAKTLADEVEFRLQESGVERRGIEGYGTDSGWILLDFGSVMVHIFYGDNGSYENLCHLWADGPEIALLSE